MRVVCGACAAVVEWMRSMGGRVAQEVSPTNGAVWRAHPPHSRHSGAAKRNPESMGLPSTDSWKPTPVGPFQPILDLSWH